MSHKDRILETLSRSPEEAMNSEQIAKKISLPYETVRNRLLILKKGGWVDRKAVPISSIKPGKGSSTFVYWRVD